MFAEQEPWPAPAHREVAWRPGLADDVVPRSVRLRHAGPYRAAVVPAIDGRTPRVAHEVLRAAEDAAAVVGNVAAMQAALDLADAPTPATVLAMHHALLHHTEPAIAGRCREEQVWVGGTSHGPHERHHGVTRSVTVPVSAGLLVDVEGYFDALTAYRQGDLNPWCRSYPGHPGRHHARHRTGRAAAGVRAGWDDVVRARSDAAAWRLADLLVRQPVVDAGEVTEFTGRRRNRMWQARDVLEALDASAARAGRRGWSTGSWFSGPRA